MTSNTLVWVMIMSCIVCKRLFIFEEQPTEINVINEMTIEKGPDGSFVYKTDGEVISPNPILSSIDNDDTKGLRTVIIEPQIRDKWDSVLPPMNQKEVVGYMNNDPLIDFSRLQPKSKYEYYQENYNDKIADPPTQAQYQKEVYSNPVIKTGQPVVDSTPKKPKLDNKKEKLKSDKKKEGDKKKRDDKKQKDKKSDSGCSPINVGYLGILLLIMMQ